MGTRIRVSCLCIRVIPKPLGKDIAKLQTFASDERMNSEIVVVQLRRGKFGHFSSNLVVKTVLPMQGAQVHFLVGESRSCMLQACPPPKKKKMCREDLTLLKLFLDVFFFQLFLRLDLVIAHFLEDSPVNT